MGATAAERVAAEMLEGDRHSCSCRGRSSGVSEGVLAATGNEPVTVASERGDREGIFAALPAEPVAEAPVRLELGDEEGILVVCADEPFNEALERCSYSMELRGE
jgi:hypothetical protein